MTAIPEGLLATREHVRDELRRADTKATTLLSLVGATLAGVIALSGRAWPLVAQVALWASAAPIAASVVLLLAVVRPRFGRGAPVPGSWLFAAQTGPARLLESCVAGDAQANAAEVCRMAVIAKAKYRRIAHGVSLLLVGLGGLGLALVLAAVTR